MTVSPAPRGPKKKRRNFPGTPHISFFGAAGGAGGERPAKTHQPAPPSGGGSARTMARRQRGADVHISFPLAAKPQDGAEWRQSSSPAGAGQGGDFRPGRKYYPVLDGHQARAARRKDRLTVRTGGERGTGDRLRLRLGAVPPRPPNRYRVNLRSKSRKPLILLVFLGFCLYRNMSTFVSNFQHKCIEKKYTNVLTTAILPCRIFLSGKTNVSNKKVHLLPEIIS